MIALSVDLEEGTVAESPDDVPVNPGDDVTWIIKGSDVSQIKLEFRAIEGPGSNGRDFNGPFAELRPGGLNSIKGGVVGNGQFKYFVLDVRNLDKVRELTWPSDKDGASVPRRDPPVGGEAEN